MKSKCFIFLLSSFLFFSFHSFAEQPKDQMTITQLKAQNAILIQALTPAQKKLLMQSPEVMQCTPPNDCNCRAGGYGYCTTKKECDYVQGTCY